MESGLGIPAYVDPGTGRIDAVSERMTPEGIRALRSKGMNQSEIATHYGVTRQAVSNMVRRYGIEFVSARRAVQASFPWKVLDQHKDSSPCKRLRDHAEYYATGGKGMSSLKLRRLLGFYITLRDNNLVVEYNPSFPPSPGIINGGWRFVPREERDNKLIVRLNDVALPLTERDIEVWRFPEELPLHF